MEENKQETMHDMIIAVCGRGFSDYVVSSARDAGATGATIIYGRGTSDYDMTVMGINIQPEREVVLILVDRNIRQKVMKAIVDSTSVIEEGRGVCFSMPVTQVYGLGRVAKQKKDQEKKARQLFRKSLSKKSK